MESIKKKRTVIKKLGKARARCGEIEKPNNLEVKKNDFLGKNRKKPDQLIQKSPII